MHPCVHVGICLFVTIMVRSPGCCCTLFSTHVGFIEPIGRTYNCGFSKQACTSDPWLQITSSVETVNSMVRIGAIEDCQFPAKTFHLISFLPGQPCMVRGSYGTARLGPTVAIT